MEPSLSSGIDFLLDRLGDGHGRRVLVRATGEESTDVRLATELARRAWAVCVLVPDADSATSARARTESAGVVVDWRIDGLVEPTDDGRFAIVACVGYPGLDEAASSELRRVLQPNGLLLTVLAKNVPAPTLPGFSAVSLARRERLVLVSARRA